MEQYPPGRYGPRLWREVAYLLLNLPVGVVGFTFAVTMLSVGASLAMTIVGAWGLVAGLYGCRALTAVERYRARALLGEDIPPPGPVPSRRRSATYRMLAVLGDGYSWKAGLYLVLMLPWGVLTFTVMLASLVVGWPALPWVARALVAVDRALLSALVSPSALEQRVRELEDDRDVVVDTAAADLRRIERDLHDGAQARLVALAMDLGLAKEKLTEDPEAAARMVDAAHGEVKLALQELRDLARGIHPAVLTDRGLDAALSSAASRCTVSGGVRVTVDLPARPARAVEGIAYFTVCELLTNVSKHSGARTAAVDLWRSGDRLLIQVRDDGKGGAREHPGSGLTGLADRIRAVDGVFLVDSPPGGPTTVTAELPWHTRPEGRTP